MNWNILKHKEPHRITPIYGIPALKCNMGFHDYQQMSVWTQGTDWFQHDCKRCGHSKWFEVKGGKEMGEKMFPEVTKDRRLSLSFASDTANLKPK